MAIPSFELRFRTRKDESPLLEGIYGPCMLLNTKLSRAGAIEKMLGRKKPEPDPFADRFGKINELLVKRLLRAREINARKLSSNNGVDTLIHAAAFLLENLPPTNETTYSFGLARPEIRIWINKDYRRVSDSLHTAGDFLFIRTPDGSYRIREAEEVVMVMIAALRILGYNAKLAYLDLPPSDLVTDRISQGKAPAVAVLDPFDGCSIATFCLSFFHPAVNGIEIYPDSAVLSYLYVNAARNRLLKLMEREKITEDEVNGELYIVSRLLRMALDIQPVAPWIKSFLNDATSLKNGEYVRDIKSMLDKEGVLFRGTELIDERVVGAFQGRPS